MYGWGNSSALSQRFDEQTGDYHPWLQSIPTSSPISWIACGLNHTLAVADGLVYTWGQGALETNITLICGSGEAGQLGHGNKLSLKQPQQVAKLSDVVVVAAGAKHSVAINSTFFCRRRKLMIQNQETCTYGVVP